MAETTGIRIEEEVINATLPVGTSDSQVIQNDGRTTWVLFVLQSGGGVMIPSLMVSLDGTNFAQAGPALTAATIGTIQRTVYSTQSTQGPIVEPFIKIRAVVTVSQATGVFATLAGL